MCHKHSWTRNLTWLWNPFHLQTTVRRNVIGILNSGVVWQVGQRSWLRHYATNRKVTGSIFSEVIGFFQLTESFQLHYGPGVDSASNEKWVKGISLVGKGQPACKADYLTTICEPIVLENVGASISQPCGPPWPVTGIDLPLWETVIETGYTGWNFMNLDCTRKTKQ
jgi:hypothetical protein